VWLSGEKAWRLDPDEIPMPSIGVGARGLPSTFGLRERQSRFIQKGLPCGCQLQWTSTPFDEPRTLCGALDSMPARYVKKACNALASRSLHVYFSRD
jgi:hypothetical protein